MTTLLLPLSEVGDPVRELWGLFHEATVHIFSVALIDDVGFGSFVGFQVANNLGEFGIFLLGENLLSSIWNVDVIQSRADQNRCAQLRRRPLQSQIHCGWM
jgi:hypothetical protein